MAITTTPFVGEHPVDLADRRRPRAAYGLLVALLTASTLSGITWQPTRCERAPTS